MKSRQAITERDFFPRKRARRGRRVACWSELDRWLKSPAAARIEAERQQIKH